MTFATSVPHVPKDWQQPVSFHGESFRNRCRWGREEMARSTAAFCLLGRDVASGLRKIAAFIDNRGELFADFRVIFIENDSIDETPDLLRQWSDENPRVTVFSETLGLARWPSIASAERSTQLAALRNRYLDLIPKLDMVPDYVVVLDADMGRGISTSGFTSSFGYEDWDVMSSNGIANEDEHGHAEFFDAWAFREHGPVERRSFREINALSFRPGMPPVPVWSAFGGMAIYRGACLQGLRYGGEDCEHVVLHERLRERGFSRHYLNPSQILLY